MNTPTRLLLGLGLAALTALPAPGATPPSPASEEPVRLYTNADLDRLGPPTLPPASRSSASRPAAPAPAYAGAEADWDFVNAWMEREYARMDRAQGPAPWVEEDEGRPRYGLALAPWASYYGYGYGYGPHPPYAYGHVPVQGHPGFGRHPKFDRHRPGHGQRVHRPGNLPAVAPRPLMPQWRPRPLMPLSYTARPPLSQRY